MGGKAAGATALVVVAAAAVATAALAALAIAPSIQFWIRTVDSSAAAAIVE
jgi:hypothetical protein